MKRIISLILAFCTVATLFSSCGESDTSKDPGGGENSDTATHTHYFEEGKCACGESDPNYEGEGEMESFVYSATVLPVKGGANGIVVLQHDDAYYDTAIIMDNLLREYGLCADVAMLSNRVWNYSNGTPKASEVEKWREILDTGRWKITSHSATHTWWGKATEGEDGITVTYDDIEKMTAEVIGSQQILRTLFPDQRVLTFAYPGFTSEKNKYTDGSEKMILEIIYSEAMRKMLDETYIAGRRVQAAYSVLDNTIDWTMSGCYHIGGNYTNNKVEKAAEQGLLTILYVHNMVNVPTDQLKTYDYPSNTMAAYYFEDTCKKLAERVASGEVWNAHYEDAVMYLREAQSAKSTVTYSDGKLTVRLTDGVMSASGCWECDVFHSKYEGREMSERFSFCTGCKHERKMLNVKQERIEASNKTKLMRKEYAKAVFEILSKERPKLYCRLEKKNIEWDKAFPSTFDDVQEGLYVALVALAEDSIGRYSFAQ